MPTGPFESAVRKLRGEVDFPSPKRNPPAGYGSVPAYSRHRKKKGLSSASAASIYRAIQSGRIDPPDAKNGWLHFKKADRQMRQWGEDRLAIGNGDEYGERYLRARADREEFAAKKLQIDVAVKLGLLVNLEDVKREMFTCYRRVRDRLLSIPDRLSAELASVDDADYIHERLTAEIEIALEEARQISGFQGGPN